MTDDKPESADFESSLKALEELVTRMEQGDLSLEESLRSFERGIELTRTCQNALQAAEQKVEALLSESESPVPLDGASTDD